MKTWKHFVVPSKSHTTLIARSEARGKDIILHREFGSIAWTVLIFVFSTVTTAILTEFGWDFNDAPKYTESGEVTGALYDIVPEGSGEPIGMTPGPVFFVYKGSNQYKKSPRVFQSRIVESIDRLKDVLEAKATKLALPTDWGVSNRVPV